MLILNYNRWI